MMSSNLLHVLNSNPTRQLLVRHPVFLTIKSQSLTRDQVAVLIGQWWHPLHFFPTFLARSIATLPQLQMKTALSKILNQEVGEGDPAFAHENLYISTMTAAGFTRDEVVAAPPLAATKELLRYYNDASAEPLSALGAVYGTEVADLTMVAGIGQAVRRLTGLKNLPWVDIHIRQEPDHVQQVGEALHLEYSAFEEAEIQSHAEQMWQCWINFFGAIDEFTNLSEQTFGQVI